MSRSILSHGIAGYQVLDRWLAKNYPRVRVLRLPAIILFSLIMSTIAALHGRLTPGTLTDLNNTDAIAAVWFLFCTIAVTYWIILQWQERSSLPPGCRARLAWSPLFNFICLIVFYLPPVVYSQQNADAIRRLAPLTAIFDAYTEIANETPDPSSQDGSTFRHGGPYFARTTDDQKKWNDCDKAPSDCFKDGFKVLGESHPDTAWCSRLSNSRGHKAIESVYGIASLQRLCRGATQDSTGRGYMPLSDSDESYNYTRNVSRFYKAYGAAGHGNIFRDHNSILGILVFLHLVGSMLAVFAVVRPTVLGGASGLLLGILTFMVAFGGSIWSYDHAPFGLMLVPLMAFAPLVIISVGLMQKRTIVGDTLIIGSMLWGSFVVTAWWRQLPRDFWTTHFYEGGFRFQTTEAQRWAAGLIVLSFVLSPLIMRVFDRYRNLPRA